MKSHRLLALLPALLIVLPALLPAQTTRTAKEKTGKEGKIVDDELQIARDAREVDEFDRLLREFDTLREARAGDSFLRINTRLRTAMNRELEQAHVKAGRAAREADQGQREVRGELQEAHASGLSGDYPGLFDDRREEDGAAARAIRMNAILSKSDSLDPAVRNGNVDAVLEQRRLMGEFLEVMRADLAATRAELDKDAKERRDVRRGRRK